jgi:hypothetical protein
MEKKTTPFIPHHLSILSSSSSPSPPPFLDSKNKNKQNFFGSFSVGSSYCSLWCWYSLVVFPCQILFYFALLIEKTRLDKRIQVKTRKRQNRTTQGKLRRDRTRQGRTRQDKTGQDKTRQDKTGEDKARQDKTALFFTGVWYATKF